MRFLALLRKELRESLPWLLLATIALLFFGSILIRDEIRYQEYYDSWREDSGTGIHTFSFLKHQHLWNSGPLLLLVSPGLGLVLGARQFLLPLFMKTWAFTIHRSVKRQTILSAKLVSSLIAFVLSTGIVWTLFYLYGSKKGTFNLPPSPRVFIEGWIFIILGFIVYLGAALSSLSTAKWYTTRLFGLAFAIVILFCAMSQYNLGTCTVLIIISVAILLSQIIHIFLTREF